MEYAAPVDNQQVSHIWKKLKKNYYEMNKPLWLMRHLKELSKIIIPCLVSWCWRIRPSLYVRHPNEFFLAMIGKALENV